MNAQIIDEGWLYKVNSKEEIGRWVSNLKYSYLWKRPSFRDESDYIISTLNFENKEDLFRILELFRIELKKVSDDVVQPFPCENYSSPEIREFKSLIKDFPEFEQPLHCMVDNTPTFIWIENGKIDFQFFDANGSYTVSEKDYESCLVFESILTENGLAQNVNREIENNVGCITLVKYPELQHNGNSGN